MRYNEPHHMSHIYVRLWVEHVRKEREILCIIQSVQSSRQRTLIMDLYVMSNSRSEARFMHDFLASRELLFSGIPA